MVILALSWPILGPTCCQLGPSWLHLGPIFAKNLHQIASGISRSAPRHPKTTQRVAKGLQDSPGAQIFMVSGSILDLIFQVFPSVSPSILHGLLASSSARWRLGARSALDIRRPRGAVVGRVWIWCPILPIPIFQLYQLVPGGSCARCPWHRQPASDHLSFTFSI